jgi:hypothetical protein
MEVHLSYRGAGRHARLQAKTARGEQALTRLG